MADQQPKTVIRQTDAQALALARRLIATARHGALAAMPVEADGFPNVSRVQASMDVDGAPVILISALSPHRAAIEADARCALLLGEAGKGDPLAHPRISLSTRAARVERGGGDHDRIRRRHLARHPKAALYADFGDFAFFRLEIAAASLNGGFGKAYEPTADDLALKGDVAGMAALEESAVAHMNDDHADAIALYAEKLAGAAAGNWRLATMDSEGMDLASGDQLVRLAYPAPLEAAADLRKVLKRMADSAREPEATNDDAAG